MKTLVYSLLLIVSIGIFSCKKKKKDEEPAPTPAPVTPAHVNSMSGKVNGSAWTMGTNAYYTSKSGLYYTFTGKTSQNSPYTSIDVYFYPATGTHTMSGFGQYYGSYYNGTNYYTSKTGTINITAIDTSAMYGLPKILKCNFSFVTDTFMAQSYTITEGSVDFKSEN